MPQVRRRRVVVDLTVDGLPEGDDVMQVGLQTSKDDLDAGTVLPDGGVRFTTEVAVGQRDDGTVTWSAPAVNGPAEDRFLYVGFRSPERGGEWTRRFKVRLPEQVASTTQVLRARVRDTGTSRPAFVGDWTEH